MNLYHLRVFQTVAEHEHITRASEELILSQPAVTKIIQSLEHETGLELIERHGRGFAKLPVVHWLSRQIDEIRRDQNPRGGFLADHYPSGDRRRRFRFGVRGLRVNAAQRMCDDSSRED